MRLQFSTGLGSKAQCPGSKYGLITRAILRLDRVLYMGTPLWALPESCPSGLPETQGAQYGLIREYGLN